MYDYSMQTAIIINTHTHTFLYINKYLFYRLINTNGFFLLNYDTHCIQKLFN